MTTTRINHTGHDHANTTAARTACRKALKAAAAANTVTLAQVGKGKFVHLAVLADDGVVVGTRCGAGLGRGVRKNSPLKTWTGDAAHINCHRCH